MREAKRIDTIRYLRDVGALIVGVHASHMHWGKAEVVFGLNHGPVLEVKKKSSGLNFQITG
jgi:hypothetical protein